MDQGRKGREQGWGFCICCVDVVYLLCIYVELWVRLWVGEASDTRRCLNRQVIRLKLLSRRWFKGIRAVVEHGLGKSGFGVHSVHVEVSKHSVRFPSAEELDGLLVDVGAE